MNKNRLEAFSDGVIAIIITIMVLELKEPIGHSWSVLLTLKPIFLSYILSYVYVGIYWNNHHHTFQAVKSINGKVLWANLHLLFWLSIIPFATSWMADEKINSIPVATYGIVLLMCAISYFILMNSLTSHHGKEALLTKAIGTDLKGKLSILFYILGIGLSFLNPWFGILCYVIVALSWLVPDKRIENVYRI